MDHIVIKTPDSTTVIKRDAVRVAQLDGRLISLWTGEAHTNVVILFPDEANAEQAMELLLQKLGNPTPSQRMERITIARDLIKQAGENLQVLGNRHGWHILGDLHSKAFSQLTDARAHLDLHLEDANEPA